MMRNWVFIYNAFQNKKGNSRCPFSGGLPKRTFSATNLHAERKIECVGRLRGIIPLSFKPQTHCTCPFADDIPLSFFRRIMLEIVVRSYLMNTYTYT
jgi:hypothetical protein